MELPNPRRHAPRREPDASRLDARRLVLAGLPGAILSIAAVPALAIPGTTLTDGNATATINPSEGVTGLTINGVQQLSLDEFFYRAGSGSIVPLTPTNQTSTGVPPNVGSFTYSDSAVSATISYVLTGGSDPTDPAALDESVTLTNKNAQSPVAIQLFKYTDFNLGGQSANQSATGSGSPVDTIDQQDATGANASDSVAQQNTSAPAGYEITNSSALLTSLQNSTLTSLNDTTSGSGDINWAFEFDKTLQPMGSTPSGSDTLSVSLNSTVTVPEPASAALALGTFAVWMGYRRRRTTASEGKGD